MQEMHSIQPYEAVRDAAPLHRLWQALLANSWPINQARLEQVLSAPGMRHFVLYEDGALIGFVGTEQNSQNAQSGNLIALLVASGSQRRGIGTRLYRHALAYLFDLGVKSVQLGGSYPRFWCGVPSDLPRGIGFFAKQGWEYSNKAYDMVQDLQKFTFPAAIEQRMLKEEITFSVATPETFPALLAFEQHDFPHWVPTFQRDADAGDFQDIVLAWDTKTQEVVGSLHIYTSQSNKSRSDLIWQAELGEDAGALGTVGVADSQRGRGIGIALVAQGSAILKERGIRNCYIDWLVLVDFYAKLGYQVWKSYVLSTRTQFE